MRAGHRRWTERDAPAPADLRLVPASLAVWTGCLVGLWAPPAAWSVAAGAVAVLGVWGLSAWIGRHRRRSRTLRNGFPGTEPVMHPNGTVRHRAGWARARAGSAAVLCCLASAAVLASLRVQAAAADPLVQAGSRGDWVVAEVVVTADPSPMRSPYPIAETDDEAGDQADGRAGDQAGDGAPESDGGGGGSAAPGEVGPPGLWDAGATRWRVKARARNAEIRGGWTGSDAGVTVYGVGAAWAGVVTGQVVLLRGVAGPDPFGDVPGSVVRAVGDPQVVSGPPWWAAWAVAARAGLVRSAAVLAEDRAGLLRGLVVGDTAGIGPGLSADAKATGLTHLVAVSGSHVAIICGFVVLLLRRGGPRIAAGGAAVTLAALVVLVGPQPSVLRAVVMGAIGLAAAVLGRARSALPGLAAAVFALLLLDPELAGNAGFALSVQATAGLMLLAPAWSGALQRRGVPRGWAQLLVLPVAAHVTTMPVIAAISGTVSLAAIPANIVVALVVAPALLLGLACTAVGPVWPAAAEFLARVDAPLLGWVTGTAHRLARWPAATVPWPASPVGVVALVALITAGLLLLRQRWLRAGAAAAVAGVVAVLVPAHVVGVGWPAPGWLLTACEVGQGDAMVLATGEPGVAVVVDTGPDPPLMDECLDRLGITDIPLLVLTHLHADHVGGLAGAIAGRTVGTIGVGPDRGPPPAWQDVLATAAGHGIPVVPLQPGTRWGRGDLTLSVLAPASAYHGTGSDPNNDSVVMMAVGRGVRILMTGDIEEPAQQALLDSGADLRADVLKQPHHGSAKILPGLLAAVSPTVAVIGVGAGNDYGHPSPSALRADAAVGVSAVLRTDRDGDVQVVLTDTGLATLARGPTLRSAAPARRGGV